MAAVAHTQRSEQSAADAAAGDLPLIQAAAARTVDTTADAFKSASTASLSPPGERPPKRSAPGQANTAPPDESLRL